MQTPSTSFTSTLPMTIQRKSPKTRISTLPMTIQRKSPKTRTSNSAYRIPPNYRSCYNFSKLSNSSSSNSISGTQIPEIFTSVKPPQENTGSPKTAKSPKKRSPKNTSVQKMMDPVKPQLSEKPLKKIKKRKSLNTEPQQNTSALMGMAPAITKNMTVQHLTVKYPSAGTDLKSGKKRKLSTIPEITSNALYEKYPVLNDKELIEKFKKVQMTNNQKGRIRQVIKDLLHGTPPSLLPDILNNKIQAFVKNTPQLNDTDLRKIRIMYNMLKKAVEDKEKALCAAAVSNKKKKDADKKTEIKVQEIPLAKKEKKDKGDAVVKKGTNVLSKPKIEAKDPMAGKRYVVFVGNLPLNVTREQIKNHFSEIRDYIKDVRIPQLAEDKKSCIAYVEFDNAPVYEMALCRHHSMMGNKRINVLYTTPTKKSKISKTEAKAKSAKLQAMAKKGQLVGSVPLKRKRSARRAKARLAQRAAEKALE